ncbi:hypothetical protein JXM67_05555 [candidate division WOR-3 bacterium]|nr:hypothetical protein [candidate division WOR-3 bacterium]
MIRGIFWGLMVAWVGLWIWFGISDVVMVDGVNIFTFNVAWPIIFIMVGLMGLVELVQKAVRSRRYGTKLYGIGGFLFWGLVFIAVGLIIWFANLGWMPPFAQWWPFLLVAIGACIIIFVLVKTLRRHRSVGDIIDKLENGKINVDDAVNEIRRTRSPRNTHRTHYHTHHARYKSRKRRYDDE